MSLLAGHAPGHADDADPETRTDANRNGRLSLSSFATQAMTPTALKVAIVALGGDALFAALRAIQLTTPFLQNPMFRLSIDGSYPEIFQYVKFFVIACLLGFLAVNRRVRWLFVWTAGFLFLLADDALMIHEGVGARFSPSVEPFLPSGIDAVAITEFGYLGLVALVMFVVAAIGMVFSPGLFRRLSVDLMLLLMVAGFFAVSVDLVHGLSSFGYVANTLFAIVEDGGEMLGASLIVIYAAIVADRRGEMPQWLSSVRRLRG